MAHLPFSLIIEMMIYRTLKTCYNFPVRYVKQPEDYLGMIYTTLPVSAKPLGTVSYDIIHHEKQRITTTSKPLSPEAYHETTIQFH